jgi:hypothetical protein
MKPRHAAALALVGWYLMYPIQQHQVLPKAPLRNWQREGSFDTEATCKQAMERNIRELQTIPRARSFIGVPGGDPYLKAAKNGECIASDDPRLKGN